MLQKAAGDPLTAHRVEVLQGTSLMGLTPQSCSPWGRDCLPTHRGGPFPRAAQSGSKLKG